MMPEYLNDLHLDQVFVQYTSNVDAFILQSCKDEHIVDSESERISGFVTPTFGQLEDLESKYFELRNPSHVPFSLLQIDNGVITSSADIKRCDCSIITDKCISFIEFKANALSIKTRTISSHYRKAMIQLSTTIELFNNGLTAFGVSLSSIRTVEANICFRRGYPRTTASEMTYRTRFANQTNVPLYFDGEMSL